VKGMQRRRLDAQSSQEPVNNSQFLEIRQTETDVANFHGLHYCFSIEPEVQDANSNGFWIVYCLPALVINEQTDLPNTFAELDNEDFLPYVWGVGCWTASNQAPFHYEFAPRTSRNCQKDARIIAHIRVTGTSSGNNRINSTLSLFSSS